MGFGQALVSGFKNYVNFSGRAPRSEYWFWVLWMIIISIITATIDYQFFDSQPGPINTIFGLATFLPSLAMGIRRLHDIDRTGWWTLIALTGIGLFVLLVFACLKGTTGPNRFGPDPLGGALNQPATA
jgi:uncharacterized membrane protein YhaH (DUF805 family)